MELKDIIKLRREELGLTLQEIADYVGVSKPTIQRYESGEIVNLKQGIIYKLAQILKISPARLMGWENPEEAVSSIMDNKIEELGTTLEKVAEEARVPLHWLQNIDTFIPGEWGHENEIGYTWITRVADILGLPGSVLRTALAQQEIPVYEGELPSISPEEAFKDIIKDDNINTDNEIHTIAAHHDGDEWTEEELEDIENFKKYVLSKRNKK